MKPITFLDFSEAGQAARKAERDRLYALDPRDMSHPKGYRFCNEHQGFEIFWGGYNYWLPLKDIPSPRKLCEWLVHITGKGWEGATSKRVSRFIESVFSRKDWNLYSDGLVPRARNGDDERAKLTPTLRWSVLKRDGYRCRACGNGPEHGAVLHIDHIIAIARGGLTVLLNLQTLCGCCNYGKRDGT